MRNEANKEIDYLLTRLLDDVRRRMAGAEGRRRSSWTTGRRTESGARATTVGAAWTTSSPRKWQRKVWRRMIISRRSRRKQKNKGASN